jgi:hypothetical protein
MSLSASDLVVKIKAEVDKKKQKIKLRDNYTNDEMFEAIAKAIIDYLTANTVVSVTANIGEIMVAGSPSAQQNAAPITIKGTIS